MKSNVAEYIFAIDEPELSLHPEQQRKFIQILKSVSEKFTNIQIIIATHSPYVVNEVKYKDVFVLTHKTKRNKKGKVIELPEIGVNSLKPRVIKNKIYKSMAEINYLAFDEEASIDYHIELFGYLHNKLQENALVPSGSGINSVDAWLANNNHTPKDQKYYDTRYIGQPSQPEDRTLPYCVRNWIDHPLTPKLNTPANLAYNKAYKNNKKYGFYDIIQESIKIMRNAIIDNHL